MPSGAALTLSVNPCYVKICEAVLKFYASKQTFDCNGVTLPSQRRYFVAKLERELAYSPVRLLLRAIHLQLLPHVGLHRREAHLQVQVH